MLVLFILLIATAIAYVPIGQRVAESFGESDNSAYIFAWPVVVVWLLGVVGKDLPVVIWERIHDPYIEEDMDDEDSLDEEVGAYVQTLRRTG